MFKFAVECLKPSLLHQASGVAIGNDIKSV